MWCRELAITAQCKNLVVFAGLGRDRFGCEVFQVSQREHRAGSRDETCQVTKGTVPGLRFWPDLERFSTLWAF